MKEFNQVKIVNKADYHADPFVGALSGDTIDGYFDQINSAYFKKSTFHVTNFTPGEELSGTTPHFV